MVTVYLEDAQPQLRQDSRALSDRVRAMLDDIEQNRDAGVRRYAKDFDRWEQPEFRVSDDEIAEAVGRPMAHDGFGSRRCCSCHRAQGCR
jgi:histidinol dehydrogenase